MLCMFSTETQSREDDLIIRGIKDSKEGVGLLPAALRVGGCCGLFFLLFITGGFIWVNFCSKAICICLWRDV